MVENTADAAPTPASWYPCPVDARLLRWWDGTVWTSHTMDVEATPDAVAEAVVEVSEAEAEAVVAVAVRGAWTPTERRRDFEMPSYTPMVGLARTRSVERMLPLVGTSSTTVWVWLLAVTPLVQSASIALIALTLDGSTGWHRFAFVGLSVMLYPLFAHGDGRVLRRRRLDSVAWAWGLLPPVYLGVRVARVGPSSLGPLIAWIALSLGAAAVLTALFLPGYTAMQTTARYDAPAGTASTETLTAEQRATLLTGAGMAEAILGELRAEGSIVNGVQCPDSADVGDGSHLSCRVEMEYATADVLVQVTDGYPNAAFVILGFEYDE